MYKQNFYRVFFLVNFFMYIVLLVVQVPVSIRLVILKIMSMDPVERKIFCGKIVWGSEKHTKMLKKSNSFWRTRDLVPNKIRELNSV